MNSFENCHEWAVSTAQWSRQTTSDLSNCAPDRLTSTDSLAESAADVFEQGRAASRSVTAWPGQMLDSERLALAGRRRDRVDLVQMTREVAADFAPLAVAQGYDIEVRAGCDVIEVVADAPALARAIGNLIANAIAHGGNRGRITVNVRPSAIVEVSDEGEGVRADAVERTFEPFRRERWDRDGCGLGLHLARTVLRAHGGDVSLIPSTRGATFRLQLPGPLP